MKTVYWNELIDLFKFSRVWTYMYKLVFVGQQTGEGGEPWFLIPTMQLVVEFNQNEANLQLRSIVFLKVKDR